LVAVLSVFGSLVVWWLLTDPDKRQRTLATYRLILLLRRPAGDCWVLVYDPLHEEAARQAIARWHANPACGFSLEDAVAMLGALELNKRQTL